MSTTPNDHDPAYCPECIRSRLKRGETFVGERTSDGQADPEEGHRETAERRAVREGVPYGEHRAAIAALTHAQAGYRLRGGSWSGRYPARAARLMRYAYQY
jgi:hypothetical protein